MLQVHLACPRKRGHATLPQSAAPQSGVGCDALLARFLKDTCVQNGQHFFKHLCPGSSDAIGFPASEIYGLHLVKHHESSDRGLGWYRYKGWKRGRS
jgi:hypothetical protein